MADVLDTARQEEYSALREQYIRTGEGFIIAHSITSRDSFEQAKAHQGQILEVKERTSWPMMLVGNKDDLFSQRTVSTKVCTSSSECGPLGSPLTTIVLAEREALARSFRCTFLETSAKTRHNIDQAFFDIERAIRIYGKILKEEEKKEIAKKKKKEAVAQSKPTLPQEKSYYSCCEGCSVI
jgi:GTPase KRas protein